VIRRDSCTLTTKFVTKKMSFYKNVWKNKAEEEPDLIKSKWKIRLRLNSFHCIFSEKNGIFWKSICKKCAKSRDKKSILGGICWQKNVKIIPEQDTNLHGYVLLQPPPSQLFLSPFHRSFLSFIIFHWIGIYLEGWIGFRS